jgi:hypothetical protein
MESERRTEEVIMRALYHLIPTVLRAPRSHVLAYRVTDRLHDGRTARVPVEGVAPTVATWLAELGAHSPMVDDLVGAVRCGDWPTAHALADRLSIDIAVAA